MVLIVVTVGGGEFVFDSIGVCCYTGSRGMIFVDGCTGGVGGFETASVVAAVVRVGQRLGAGV